MPAEGGLPQTSWSLVLKAAADGQRTALQEICLRYWPPVFAFIRARVHDSEQARDLTQEFFTRLIERHYLQEADPARGRFRSFLYASVRHFLSNQRDWERAEKRGGGRKLLSLTIENTDDWHRIEPSDMLDPEKVFERRWALLVIERALARLRDHGQSAGHLAQYEVLKAFLTSGNDDLHGHQAADRLGMSEPGLRMAVHRLRGRFASALRAEVSETVNKSEEVDSEIRHLLLILSG